MTDANGAYSFDNVALGNVTIRASKNTDIDWTNPDSGKHSETVTYGNNLPGRDFGYVTDTLAPNAEFTPLPWYFRNAPVASIDIVFSEPVTALDLTDFYFINGDNLTNTGDFAQFRARFGLTI